MNSIEELANAILQDDLENFLDIECDDPDEAYSFFGEAFDDVKWIETDKTDKKISTELTLIIPANSFIQGCDVEHTFKILADFTGSRNENDIELKRVYVDEQKCERQSLDWQMITGFVFDRLCDGWAPDIVYGCEQWLDK